MWPAMIEMQISAKLKIKAELMIKIRDVIDQQQLSQSKVAEIAGVTQPRISNLLNGRIDLFTADSLIDIAEALGVKVCVAFSGQTTTPPKR